MRPLKALYIFLVNHTVINKTITFIVFYTVTGFAEGDIRIGVVAAYVVFRFLNPRRTVTGVFRIAGQEYKYIYGDRIKIAGETLNGIQVELPAYLPHIYVDLHSNNGLLGLQRSFVDIKKYNLEGDFGTRTIVYANYKDRLDVLSVLNPETMRVLLDIAKDYDLECIDNRLMLYSRKKVYYNPQKSTQLLTAAQVVVTSLHQSLQRGKLLNKGKSTSMLVAPSDRLVTFNKYSVGSARRILASFCLLFIAIGFYIGFQSTYTSNAPTQHIDQIIRIILVTVWLCVSLSVIYIGFSRKKIDIRWS